MGHVISTPGPSPVIARVGQRVRDMREAQGISRTDLSKTSGVSLRFLAQLEAGDGNISIARLETIAVALGCEIADLVGASDACGDLQASFRKASPALQRRVLDLLQDGADGDPRMERICLIGLRGAGKSTLGQGAAKALGVPFVELNTLIEDSAGIPVAEIMALYGQEGYRQLEADALTHITETQTRVVVEVAGGIVAEPASYARLLAQFHTVWIKAGSEDHMNRVRAQGDTRPMGNDPRAMDQLRAILSAREALYTRANGCIDTSGATVAQSLGALLALIEDRQFLKRA